MKRDFWLDTIFGTAFIFILMWAVVKLFSFFDVLDPIGTALSDLKMTDLRFSVLREDPVPDTNIVLVNIGALDRAGIAQELEIISKYDPKVIGVDVIFDTNKEGWKDTLLMNAMAGVDNLVLVSKAALYNEEDDHFDTLVTSIPMLNQHAKTAQANLISIGAKDQSDFKVVRTFAPKLPIDDQKEEELAFAVKLAKEYDPEAAEKFLARDNREEIINYRGNVMDFGRSSQYGNMFFALDVADVFQENFVPELIKDKIVIFGYLGDSFYDLAWEDKFFTPMNNRYAGRANPDMYGPVIHANIAAMILDGQVINSMSEFTGILFGIIICYLNVVAFTYIYRALPKWYDGITKIIQLVEVLVLFFIVIMIFDRFDFMIDITLAAAATALAGDALEVYNGVVKNLFSAEGRRQLFKVYKS